jgi:twinfilin-like protein
LRFCLTVVNSKNKLITCFFHPEELALSAFKEASGTWEEDYNSLVTPLIEDEQPSYILFR